MHLTMPPDAFTTVKTKITQLNISIINSYIHDNKTFSTPSYMIGYIHPEKTDT